MKQLSISFAICALTFSLFFITNCTEDECLCKIQKDSIFIYQYDTIYHFDTLIYYNLDTVYINSNLPYKSYSSIIYQADTSDPTETVLLNELNLSINWKRLSQGKFEGKLSKSVKLNKTIINFKLQEVDKIPTGGFKDSVTILLYVVNRLNVYDTNDGIDNGQIEIKTYGE